MKKYFILTSVFALAACAIGGGSGGGGVGDNGLTIRSRYAGAYTTPYDIRAANSSVTQMETFSSNADAIVYLVRGSGIDLESDSIRVSPRLATHRSSTKANELSAAFAKSGTELQKLAMAELENLYNIATNKEGYWTEISQSEDFVALVREAFILSGGDPNSFNASNLDAAKATIIENYNNNFSGVFDKIIAKDGEGNYLWTPKINSLEEVD